MTRSAGVAILLSAVGLVGCQRQESEPSDRWSAEFGILFGGQIQERRDIPFEIDPAKQSHGFHIDFAEPLENDLPIEWEIDKPGTSKRVRDEKGRPGRGRLSEIQQTVARAGTKRFEHAMSFEPGDPLGLWNIRVVAGKRVVIDRPFTVYDPAARRRAMPSDAGL